MDELGRIVLPIEIRNTLDINAKDSLEIFVEDGTIILKKYQPSCVFCGSAEDNVVFGDKRVCKACIAKLGQAK